MELQYQDNPHQWILTTRLTQGEVKFRADDSWTVNWGATDFPGGTGGQDGANIPVPATGYYTIYFNDLSGDYHFEALSPEVYKSIGIRGDATAQGWGASIPMQLSPEDPHQWTLDEVTLTSGELKFLAENNWDLMSWGGSTFPEGRGSQSGWNIRAIPGVYEVTFNDVTGDYRFKILDATVYQTVGIIGSATAHQWDRSTPMQQIAENEPHQWSLTTYLEAGELKFRANDEWMVSWGATAFPSGIANSDSGNLKIPQSGYYRIDFNDFSGVYEFENLNPVSYNSVGILGSATPGSWNSSTPMQQEADGHTWTLKNYELSAGEVKFRVDNKWDVNWGGESFPEGVASPGGENIPVVPGIYNIRFNDFTKIYSFELVEAAPGGIVVLSPAFPTIDEPVTITYDASQGASALQDAEQVYMHAGVILSGPEGTTWSNVTGNWGQDDGVGKMTPVEGQPDKWQISLPNPRDYFVVEDGLPVFRLGMVFRNADGTRLGKSADNGDIFVDINPGDYVRFTAPKDSEVFALKGDPVQLDVEASERADFIRVELDQGSGFETIHEETGVQSASFKHIFQDSGMAKMRVTAKIKDTTFSSGKVFTVHLREENTIAELPEGLEQGINYDPKDSTKATLVLLAPKKEFVYAVGDFNNWEVSESHLMNQTPDGDYYWLELNNLEPGKEYVFQYWVNGRIKIGDPYADKVVDPYSDKDIPLAVYPDPVAYNRTQDGLATVLETGQIPYKWSYPDVVGGRPAKEDLVIYELLVRDFVKTHSYKELIKKLPYLKELGVNAIELMPVMEFENNDSWGYNPIYLFAPDKYYGTKNDLKAFIDKAHEYGMVVLLDMVHNHQFGQSPMVRMYFDKENSRPSPDSPWFNPEPTHPYNVGYDMNHESQYTKDFIDDVNTYWLEEYHFDGYRFDLTKGFTQRENPDDVGAWSAYDQSRVDILKRMADKIWETDSSAYVIMEHLAHNSEEKVLADYGIMLWGNMNHAYSEVVLGNTTANLNWSLSSARGWKQKNLVSYMESHDEERLMVKAMDFGMSNGNYNIRELPTALERIKLASAFYYPVPGPKMIWQFGELGYDYPINFNGRTGNKPIPFADELNYDKNEDRLDLYQTKSAIINLVDLYPDVFEEGKFNWTPEGQLRHMRFESSEMNVLIVGNFGTSAGEIPIDFPKSGTWYDFFSGEAFRVEDLAHDLPLSPGEFHLLLDQKVSFPEPGITSNTFIFMSVPSELEAAIEGDGVELVWEDNAAGESGYLLQRREEDAQDFLDVAILDPNQEYYFDKTVVDGRTYLYRLKAVSPSEGDTDWSNHAKVDLPLNAPAALEADLKTPTTTVLFWEDKSDNETAYLLERSVEHGMSKTSFEVIASVAAGTTEYDHLGVRPGMTYHYRVVANDDDENSPYSNIMTIRPADELGVKLQDNLILYPNPASERVHISLRRPVSGETRLQIVSMQGVVIKTFSIEAGASGRHIPIGDIGNGIYIVKQVNREDSSGTLLVIER